MSFDDFLRFFFGGLLALLTPVIFWVVRTVLDTREHVLLLVVRTTRLEADVMDQAKKQLTTDNVREVIDAALEKRDKIYEARRVEWDRTRILEIKSVVKEEVDRVVESLRRE